MAFSTAFQSNAFQNNAFQIAVKEEVVAGGVIQPAGQFSRQRWRRITEEEARKRLEARQEAEWKAERERVARQLKRDTDRKAKQAKRDARFAEQDEQYQSDALHRAGLAADQIQFSLANINQAGQHTELLARLARDAQAQQDEEDEMLMLLELA